MRIKDMKFRTKLAVGATAVAASLAAGGVAFAYISGGSGSGVGSVSTSAPTLSGLTVTSATATATFNGADDAISVVLHNGATYSISAGSIDVAVGTLPANCSAGSFVMDTSHVAGPFIVPAGGNSSTITGATVKFVDSTTADQTGCTTAPIPLTVTINSAA